MKAIICVKIGENEPSTYAKYDHLYKHLDIVDVFPPKYDEHGNLRGMGVMGDKEYLGIVANFGDITNEEFGIIRSYLREEDRPIIPNAGDRRISYAFNKRRFHKLDMNNVLKTNLSLTQKKIDKIEEMAEKRARHEEIDMREFNDYTKSYDFRELAKSILHKDKATVVYKNLELDKKTLKTAIMDEKVKRNGDSNIDNK